MENMNRNQKIDVDNDGENKTLIKCNFSMDSEMMESKYEII